MKRTSFAILALGVVLVASLMAAVPSAFNSSRAFEDLRQIVGFGPRPAGSPALGATRGYIRQQLKAAGVEVADQTFQASTPIGPVRMTNLIATVPGTRTERLVFMGHYDTKLFRDFTFVGADDGGSSAAFLIELARVLKARKNPLTMELLFLDGEEAFHPTEWQGTDHTYGSRYYVEAAKKSGTLGTIGAAILVDMVGNRDIHLKRENNSTPWLTDIIWSAAKKIGLQGQFVDQSSSVEDDHNPFLDAGVAAVDLIDLDGYQYWHTREDTLDKCSARSLQVVGDALLASLPAIEAHLTKAGGAPSKGKTAARHTQREQR